MQEKLLSQLYNGEINPSEQLPRITTDGYEQLCTEIDGLESNLRSQLSNTEQLDQYKQKLLELHSIELSHCFEHGVRFGGKFIMEICQPEQSANLESP